MRKMVRAHVLQKGQSLVRRLSQVIQLQARRNLYLRMSVVWLEIHIQSNILRKYSFCVRPEIDAGKQRRTGTCTYKHHV